MEELYKENQDLQIDLNSPPSTLPNKLENGVAQLITAEAWNINPSGLMKKALSPLVTVPAPAVLSPSSDSQSGVAMKMAAAVLQPICLGESPVVLPIHWQLSGGTPPQMSTNSSTPYVITAQGPVPLPVLLEQHVFQHLNSPLVLPQGSPCPATSLQSHIFPSAATLVGQPQILDQKTSSPTQEAVLPPIFTAPSFPSVLQDFFPSANSLGAPPPCHIPPDYASSNLHTIPPQLFSSSPLSPLVPPATLLVPYPVIVPLPVPVPIPIPIPIPMSHSETKGSANEPKSTVDIPKNCKETQTPLEKELKPFEIADRREFSQFYRHSVIKMSSENEALDLSIKNEPLVVNTDISTEVIQDDGVLDLSVPINKRCPSTNPHGSTSMSCGSMSDSPRHLPIKNSVTAASFSPPLVHHELAQKQDSKVICSNTADPLRQQKWIPVQSARAAYEPKSNNIELVSSSQTAKVIVSVKDAVPAIFCGKIKGLSGVSTKNFSFKKDLPQVSGVQCYDVKGQAEHRETAEALRKPIKNRSVKLKKVNSQEIHILPIKKQRLAAFFPRK